MSAAAAAAAANARSVWRRRIAKHSRWLHIYISMFSCAVVLFFAVTGLTLNHADWFAGAEETRELSGVVNAAWTNTDVREPARLEIVEFLRATHGLTGAVTDFRSEDTQLSVSFKGPGRSADVFIDRASGTYQLTETRQGLVAVVNDLHKGRDSGVVWKALIDASAIFLCFVAVTGLALLYFIHKHRFAGLVLLAGGAAVSCLLYLVWVP
jgi:hypothetical protein